MSSDIHLLLEKLSDREICLLKLMGEYPLRIDKGVWILYERPINVVPHAKNYLRTKIFRDIRTLEEIGLTEKQNNEIHLNHLGQKVAEYVQERDQKLYEESKSKREAESNAIIELYKQGFSYQDIGTQYNISENTVRQQVAEYVKKRDQKLYEESKSKREAESNAMIELYKQGFSYQDIGTQYNISENRVRQLLSKNRAFRDYLREKE